MLEKDMFAVGIVVVIFVLLAYDLSSNNGQWVGIVSGFANDVLRGIRDFLWR